MKREPDRQQPNPSDKTAHDRFIELGSKIMSVKRADVDEREKKWQAGRRGKNRR